MVSLAGSVVGGGATNASGTWEFSLFVPFNTQPGIHTVVVSTSAQDAAERAEIQVTINNNAQRLPKPGDGPILNAYIWLYFPVAQP